MELNELLGRNLKQLREAAGKSQSEIAEIAEISIRYYQKIEAGKNWPSPQTLAALARTLGISVDAIFSTSQHSQKRRKRAFFYNPSIPYDGSPHAVLRRFDRGEALLEDIFRVSDRLGAVSPKQRKVLLALLFEAPELVTGDPEIVRALGTLGKTS